LICATGCSEAGLDFAGIVCKGDRKQMTEEVKDDDRTVETATVASLPGPGPLDMEATTVRWHAIGWGEDLFFDLQILRKLFRSISVQYIIIVHMSNLSNAPSITRKVLPSPDPSSSNASIAIV